MRTEGKPEEGRERGKKEKKEEGKRRRWSVERKEGEEVWGGRRRGGRTDW